MVCSFCGTENRPENKFCGMCGVRLERRQAERRSAPTTASLHCVACNTINEPGYKFCGNCGTRLDRRIGDRRGAEVKAGSSGARGTDTASPRPADRRQPAPVLIEEHPAREGPIHNEHAQPVFRSEVTEHHGIQGPSFLGLSDDPDHEADYLLEDEGSSRGGLRKLVLVAILAAIIGLIFVQWRSSLHANPKHSTPTTTAPAPSPQSGTQSPASATDEQSKQAEPASMAQEPALPVSDGRKSAEVHAEPSPGPQTAESPAPESLNVADRSTDPPPAASATPEIPADQKPSNTLVRAQQFLQGKGVAQNCEQGLIYLRAAAQKNEPAAAVQMGALYAAGHCVQQDKVMAYRWFNAAHELQPANQWIQQNLNQLWAQMSEQEHRLAAY